MHDYSEGKQIHVCKCNMFSVIGLTNVNHVTRNPDALKILLLKTSSLVFPLRQ